MPKIAYRILKPHEIIQPDDEYTSDERRRIMKDFPDLTWLRMHEFGGVKCGVSSVEFALHLCRNLTNPVIRRKVKVKPWMKLSKNMPIKS